MIDNDNKSIVLFENTNDKNGEALIYDRVNCQAKLKRFPYRLENKIELIISICNKMPENRNFSKCVINSLANNITDEVNNTRAKTQYFSFDDYDLFCALMMKNIGFGKLVLFNSLDNRNVFVRKPNEENINNYLFSCSPYLFKSGYEWENPILDNLKIICSLLENYESHISSRGLKYSLYKKAVIEYHSRIKKYLIMLNGKKLTKKIYDALYFKSSIVLYSVFLESIKNNSLPYNSDDEIRKVCLNTLSKVYELEVSYQQHKTLLQKIINLNGKYYGRLK